MKILLMLSFLLMAGGVHAAQGGIPLRVTNNEIAIANLQGMPAGDTIINRYVTKNKTVNKTVHKTVNRINTEAVDTNTETIENNWATTTANSERLNSIEYKQDKLQRQLYGVKASVHAITNARPIPYTTGDTAVGFGLGTAGGEESLAIGVGHRFTKSFSVSATMSAVAGNNFEAGNIAAGAGAQFNF
jgi:hypothetical protein